MALTFPGAARVSDSLRAYARQWANKLKEYNRAQSPVRHTMVATIEAIPLSADHSPAGDSFGVVTRDISCSGIGFLSDFPIETPYVRLKIKSMRDTGLVEVIKCEPVGSFYDISGRFVAASEPSAESPQQNHEHHLRHYQQALLRIVESIDSRLTTSGGHAVPSPPSEQREMRPKGGLLATR